MRAGPELFDESVRSVRSVGGPLASRQAGTDQTRRRLEGRTPLCGIGVTSRIEVMVKPTAARPRSALSRPEPGPFTSTSRVRTPCSALEAHHAGAGPADRIALRVGDGDHRVVEAGVDVRDAARNVLFVAAPYAAGFACHDMSSLQSIKKGKAFRSNRKLTSSCRRSAWPCPCGCGRWCECAGRERADRHGDAGRGRT